MTQAFRRIEGGAPVQQAAIVEHQQIAGLQQKADLEIRRAQAVVEQLPRPVVGVEALGRKQRHEIQPRAEVDGLEITTEVELDERRTRGQLDVDVEVFEPHRRAREHAERLRMLFAQRLRHGEAIHQR